MTDNRKPVIILASGSPRRRELLSLLGLPLKIMPSDTDESFRPEWKPEYIVSTLALRKAAAVLGETAGREAVVVGSDTIVVLDGQVLGKPVDAEDARRMLASLQGRSHKVYTGVACIRTGMGGIEASLPEGIWDSPAWPGSDSLGAVSVNRGDSQSRGVPALPFGRLGQYAVLPASSGGEPAVIAGYTGSEVTFRPMSEEEINGYIATGEPMDKAGSYGIQGIGSVFIERMEGDFYSVMGLPLNLLYAMLQNYNIRPFHPDR